jgi:hypothetical protein
MLSSCVNIPGATCTVAMSVKNCTMAMVAPAAAHHKALPLTAYAIPNRRTPMPSFHWSILMPPTVKGARLANAKHNAPAARATALSAPFPSEMQPRDVFQVLRVRGLLGNC